MTLHHSGSFSIFRHVFNAFLADVLLPVGDQSSGRTAENARRLEFLQDNAVTLHVDFQLVPLRDVQCAAQFNRQYDSSQLVHLPDNARRLHCGQLPSLPLQRLISIIIILVLSTIVKYFL